MVASVGVMHGGWPAVGLFCVDYCGDRTNSLIITKSEKFQCYITAYGLTTEMQVLGPKFPSGAKIMSCGGTEAAVRCVMVGKDLKYQ